MEHRPAVGAADLEVEVGGRERQDQRRKVYEAEVASRRATLMAELEDLERLYPIEPPDERAARLAELNYRKRI